MIIVNCIGGYAAVHSVFKHNDNYFSYADSIMPSFHFAVGCSYRLMFLRRSATAGPLVTRLRFVRRAFALIAIAVLFFGAGGGFRDWQQFMSCRQHIRSAPTMAPKLLRFSPRRIHDVLRSVARYPSALARRECGTRSLSGHAVGDPAVHRARPVVRLAALIALAVDTCS
jgi:hypothetical protein